MDAHAWLEAPVTDVHGVSARAAGTLRSSFGIRTVRDLLEHYPHQDKYRDTGDIQLVAEASMGEVVTIIGYVGRWSVFRPGGGRRPSRQRRRGPSVIAKLQLIDDAGGMVEVPFFNQDWRVRAHPQGSRIAVSGKLDTFRGLLQLKSPKVIEVDDPAELDARRIQPTYPAAERLSSPRIAALVRAALDALPPLPDPVPDILLARHGLVDLDTALRSIHGPASMDDARRARARLVYDELLTLQLGLQRRRHRLQAEEVGLSQPPVDAGFADRFLLSLPFQPTGAQNRAFQELAGDLGGTKPMHRLLQGDVGSGKTLVAVWAMLTALDNGRQAVLMVPTEVLAEQHARTLTTLLAPLGVNGPGGPRLDVLTGSTSAAKLRGLLAEVAVGDIGLLVGTHALLEERVRFDDLGLIVIDEQHRFGVEHRTRLKGKRADDRTPDVLVMTATPIPRSLALTVYGDLDVTNLDELPPGRQPVVTTVIPSDSPRRAALYDFVRERVRCGERAYVVCPLVTESDAVDAPSAVATYERLRDEVFPDLDVALVHGQMSGADKDIAMSALREGTAQILVATTVIEVGIDVPEASIMIIEAANRFGISQLHQLRGRVGRGTAKSYCVLLDQHGGEDGAGNEAARDTAGADTASVRLEALAKTADGFALAEIDLSLRGEGSLFDTRQSGLPDLKLASLVRDRAWISATRDDAREFIAGGPDLSAYPALAAEVRRRYGEERLEALETG